jgi:hypothetical protein
MTHEEAKRDKRAAALSSVIAAVGLTTFKLIVGLLTNSLGILAEAGFEHPQKADFDNVLDRLAARGCASEPKPARSR